MKFFFSVPTVWWRHNAVYPARVNPKSRRKSMARLKIICFTILWKFFFCNFEVIGGKTQKGRVTKKRKFLAYRIFIGRNAKNKWICFKWNNFTKLKPTATISGMCPPTLTNLFFSSHATSSGRNIFSTRHRRKSGYPTTSWAIRNSSDCATNRKLPFFYWK